MDKKDEELKRLLEEDLKRKMEKTEFNNPEEDLEISKEEKFIDENNDKKKMILIVGSIVCVLILLIIIFGFVFKGSNSSNEEKKDNNSNEEEKENNGTKETTIKEEDYDYSTGKVYFNKYLVVSSKTGNKKVVVDFDNNVIESLTTKYQVFEGNDKSLYLVNLDNNNLIIKMIKDNKSYDIFNDKALGLLIGKENNNILGFYKEENKKDTIYILNNDKYDTLSLDSTVEQDIDTNNIYVYNGKYIYTYGGTNEQTKTPFSGVYDIKLKKQVLDNTYERVNYLNSDIFDVLDGYETKIINKDKKELLKLDYDIAFYSNDLYFLRIDNILHVYDKNFNNLNTEINFSNVDSFDLIPFKNCVIVNGEEIITIEKDGTMTNLGQGHMAIVGNYFIKSSTLDTYIEMYDENLTVKHKINVGKKDINLDNVYLYLNNNLVIDNNKLYDLGTDSSKGSTSWFRRTSQEYEVRIDFKGDTGTITISKEEEVLKTLENVSIKEFLKTNNNGITITKDYFIYNAGGVIILKREIKES